MNTLVVTRLWGPVELDVTYDGFRWQEAEKPGQTVITAADAH